MTGTRVIKGDGVDRRNFLQGAAGGTLAMTLGLTPSASAVASTPKRGGHLRVAILGGSSTETLDPHTGLVQPDFARTLALFEPLIEMQADTSLKFALAESMEPNADATEWTIRLRKGIRFHDGKPLRSNDVAYTFRRIVDPKAPLSGSSTLALLDVDKIIIVDDLTLRVPMKKPFAILKESVCFAVYYGIVPEGFDPHNPVGTGPFRTESFTPGQESTFTRFEDYWGAAPHIDKLTISSFPSDVAAFNALQSGQIDAFAYAPLSLVRQVEAQKSLKALVSEAGQIIPFTMRVDTPPFDNPDVRKAFRLLVNREQMIKVALSGYGVVGADVSSLWDPNYEPSLHRSQDIDQAKFLLRKAGQQDLSVELVTSDFANGVTQMAQVFARQASAAGVTVNVRQVTTDVFYGDQYLKWPFAQDLYLYFPYLVFLTQSLLPKSPYNQTHWVDPTYANLFERAVGTVDEAKRKDLVHELMRIDFTDGSYIIPSFNKTVDLLAHNVEGLTPAKTGYALGNFAWRTVWLS